MDPNFTKVWLVMRRVDAEERVTKRHRDTEEKLGAGFVWRWRDENS